MNDSTQGQGHLARALAITVAVSVVVILFALWGLPKLAAGGLLPPVASDRAGDVDQVLMIFTLLSVPIFVFVVVFTLYSAVAFRSPTRPMSDGPALRGSLGMQVSWIAISVALVAFLFGYGLYFLNKITAPASANSLVVNVTGEQWLWNYSYPQYNNVGGTTLELPAGQPVEFDITSIDVQHSFWIPAFGVKEDAVPGQITHITNVTPTKIGDYQVRCAELCGLYHAYMNTPVKIVSASDFAAWIAQQQPTAPSSTFNTSVPAIAMVGVQTSAGPREE
jgi:cytochrome c oxidase subunit II